MFPCVREYFVTEDLDLERRLALVRARARSAGWRIVAQRRERGATVELERGPFTATYALEPDNAVVCRRTPRCLTGTTLTVYAPPAALPAPSAAERASWSAEKRAFVADANAVCTRMRARMADPDAAGAALSQGAGELAALEPPSGEQNEVDALLRPLRRLAEAARALTDGKGEDGLPALIAVGEFAKRFNEAASRYGLGACARLG